MGRNAGRSLGDGLTLVERTVTEVREKTRLHMECVRFSAALGLTPQAQEAVSSDPNPERR